MYSSFFEWMIELAWRETQQFGQATRRWRWIGPLRMRAGGQQGAGQSVEARIRVRVMSRRLRRSPLADQVRDPQQVLLDLRGASAANVAAAEIAVKTRGLGGEQCQTKHCVLNA